MTAADVAFEVDGAGREKAFARRENGAFSRGEKTDFRAEPRENAGAFRRDTIRKGAFSGAASGAGRAS